MVYWSRKELPCAHSLLIFSQTIIRIEMDKVPSLSLQEEKNCSSIWEQRELCFTEGIMQGCFRLRLMRWLLYAFVSSYPDILSPTICLLGNYQQQI